MYLDKGQSTIYNNISWFMTLQEFFHIKFGIPFFPPSQPLGPLKEFTLGPSKLQGRPCLLNPRVYLLLHPNSPLRQQTQFPLGDLSGFLNVGGLDLMSTSMALHNWHWRLSCKWLACTRKPFFWWHVGLQAAQPWLQPLTTCTSFAADMYRLYFDRTVVSDGGAYICHSLLDSKTDASWFLWSRHLTHFSL